MTDFGSDASIQTVVATSDARRTVPQNLGMHDNVSADSISSPSERSATESDGASNTLSFSSCVSAHEQKVQFMSDALKENAQFEKEVLLSQEVLEALRWSAEKSAASIMKLRENLIADVEAGASTTHIRRTAPLVRKRRSTYKQYSARRERAIARRTGQDHSGSGCSMHRILPKGCSSSWVFTCVGLGRTLQIFATWFFEFFTT